MIICHASEWIPERDKHPTWTHVIDLRPCNTETEMIRACVAILHGSNSVMGGMQNEPNFNWMTDVVGDWFVENWGKKKNILIVGGANLFKIDAVFALNFLDVLNRGVIDAIFDRCQRFDADGVVSEVQNTHIVVFLN